jgi:type III restriction enzyme
LARQLTDVVPNPWQAGRILQETLDVLRERQEVTEEKLYMNRLELIRVMKAELKKTVNQQSERLFRRKLEDGDIRLHLASAKDPKLSWKLAETLELEIADTDRVLHRKNGEPLERSLFEKVYQKEFNDLEKNTAWYLDEKECITWWHRIAVRGEGYGLQGWQRHKVYPDLLACIHEVKTGTYRFTVLETKGQHLKGNDDTAYKRELFEVLSLYAGEHTTLGQLELGEKQNTTRFEMVMEGQGSSYLDGMFTDSDTK